MSILLPITLMLIFASAGLAASFGLPGPNKRLNITRLSWLLAIAPFTAFVMLAALVPSLNQGQTYTWQIEWLPSLGLSLGFYYDSLSALFAMLVTAIGGLVIIYTGQYFKGNQTAWRFLSYMLLFMGVMLGLVLAGDVITLFIFWEGTSIVSFLLIAYNYQDPKARRSGFQALFITGGGGIALLAGLLFTGYLSGSSELTSILASGETLRNSAYYPVFFGLIAFGAFTKSAQAPAHIWLPKAMSAPTPASAYLHSATMVKAGIYLLARLNPALGFTETWFWTLTLVGLVTMLVGAYLGFKQNDIKALLAYSTISQLGILVILIGQDNPSGYKALVIGILAHALYKSALFMVAGIVDKKCGTRDLRRLGGLARVMPYTFAVATLAALSMAGLPPLFGFLAKETLLAAAIHPSLPPQIVPLFTWSSVLAGALILAQAGMLIWDTFLGKARDPHIHAREAPWAMLLAPAVPAFLSLVFAQLPAPKGEATFLANAASTAFSDTVKVSTRLWTGLNVPLALSIVAISLGLLIFYQRQRIRAAQRAVFPQLSFNALYTWVLQAIDKCAYWATRLQAGKLRTYLVILIAGTIALVVGVGNRALIPVITQPTIPEFDFQGEVIILHFLALVVVIGASLATVLVRRDFSAILALGASGLSMALIFILEPAPDVALVQIVVDILAMVIMVLALTRLPRVQRRKAQELVGITQENRQILLRDGLVAAALGVVVALIAYVALITRPRLSALLPYYEANAKKLTGATDIVGAIVVDFRAMDTLIEITVFSAAGLGIYALLRYAARRHRDRSGNGNQREDGFQETAGTQPGPTSTYGIGSRPASPLIRLAAYVTLPLTMVLGASHMMYGHDGPGDGFTAGVIISLAIALWVVVFGYQPTRKRLPWLRPYPMIATGLLLAIANGAVSAYFTKNFIGNYDYTQSIDYLLPAGFHISTSFMLEVAICLCVLGSANFMIAGLGRPDDWEEQQAVQDSRSPYPPPEVH